jgi:hypothetical protein
MHPDEPADDAFARWTGGSGIDRTPRYPRWFRLFPTQVAIWTVVFSLLWLWRYPTPLGAPTLRVFAMMFAACAWFGAWFAMSSQAHVWLLRHTEIGSVKRLVALFAVFLAYPGASALLLVVLATATGRA